MCVCVCVLSWTQDTDKSVWAGPTAPFSAAVAASEKRELTFDGTLLTLEAKSTFYRWETQAAPLTSLEKSVTQVGPRPIFLGVFFERAPFFNRSARSPLRQAEAEAGGQRAPIWWGSSMGQGRPDRRAAFSWKATPTPQLVGLKKGNRRDTGLEGRTKTHSTGVNDCCRT